jgi:hypothetical protein
MLTCLVCQFFGVANQQVRMISVRSRSLFSRRRLLYPVTPVSKTVRFMGEFSCFYWLEQQRRGVDRASRSDNNED